MKKLDVQKILFFYLNNNFSHNIFCRNFSENILINFSIDHNSLFFLLKLLTQNFNFKKESEWLLIFMKRTILFFSKTYTKFNHCKLIEAFIEVSICSKNKIYHLIEENLEIIFNLNKKRRNLEKFIYLKVSRIVREKLASKRPSDYTQSILCLFSTLILSSKDILNDIILNSLSWQVSDFFLKISNFDLIYVGNQQLNCLMLIEKIFKKIKTYNLCPKMSFDILIHFLIIFLNIHFSTNFPFLFEKSFWSSIGNFENRFSKSVQNFENEVVTVVPVFLTFFFLDLKYKFFYFNNSKIVFLNFLFLTDSFQRIISHTLSKNLVFLVFKNLLSLAEISKPESVGQLKIFSQEKKFNRVDKTLNLNRILYSVEIKKKKSPYFFNIMDFIHSFFSKTCDISAKISVFYSISFLVGNSLSGVNITRYNLEIKKELYNLVEVDLVEKFEKNFVYFIDLISFYRYQLSIKKIQKLIKTILEKKVDKFKIKNHFFNFIERILSTKGNDGNGIQLLELNNYFLTETIDIFYFSIQNKNYSKNSIQWFLKLLMRITSGFTETSEKNRNFTNNIILLVLKNIDTERCGLHSTFFLIETIFFILKNFTNIHKDLGMGIINFSHNIILKNQIELLPYVFEIFSNYEVFQDENFFEKILYRLFCGICNPHVWNNKILVYSMLRFLNSFVTRFSRSLSNKDTINILKILTCLIKYYNQSGTQLFKKYFKTLRNLPRFLNFLPHVFEKLDFFKNPIEFKKKQKFFLIFFFVNLTNFDLLLLEKLINKVKVNGLLFLIDKVNYKDCNNQICIKNIELFQGFFKNNSFIINLRIKKFLKIITRNLINFSWEFKEFLQENFRGERTNLRIMKTEIDLVYFKKVKNFFQLLYFRLEKI